MKIDSLKSISTVNENKYNFDNENKKVTDKSNIKSQPDSLQANNKSNKKELEEEVKKSVQDINDIVEKVKEDLAFKLHDKTDRLMVQVVDRSTREVIKELPPEEMLDLAARIHEMVGLLIDEKV